MGFLSSDDELPLEWRIASSRDTDIHYRGEHPLLSALTVVVAFGIPLALLIAFVVAIIAS